MKSRELFDFSVKSQGIIGFKIDDVDTAKRTVRAVGNTAKVLDSQLDVLEPGNANKSIKLNGPDSDSIEKIMHAKDHNLTTIPGKMTKIGEEQVTIKGQSMTCLCFESKLSDTQLGNELLTQYLDGTYNQHSIGFKYLDYKFMNPQAHGNSAEGKEWNEYKDSIVNMEDYDEIVKGIPDWMGPDAKKILVVKEIQLFEISTVARGANKLTPALGVKGTNPSILALDINTRLKNIYKTMRKGISDTDLYSTKLQIMQLQSCMDEIFAEENVKKMFTDKNNLLDIQKDNLDLSEKLFSKGFLV